MVNISRGLEVPASLSTHEIKLYIDQVILFKNDPVNNPKPEKPVSYRNSDLLSAFDRDFYSKCYLTEMKYVNSWSMDIEHFIPQSECPELVYEWKNLFPADHYSNMIKPRNTPTGGYLNPCEPTEDVESEIKYSLSSLGADPHFEASNVRNRKALNTCELLERIHNGHDEPTKNATSDLRHAIHKKYIEILNKIIKWQAHPEGTQEKYQAKRELRDLLSRKSSFTMLCRSIPAVREYLPADIYD
ncbi:MAG TPA: hypothetical protein DCZ94_03185 [Lentisphaeria bacterium]|nr:MAG: hypothetical protein A2X48_03425 [Lentisphaerae bacterium GWF2_49_21]HBC85938.1 hypothetical protein [Lentisphaeria bacterium]